MKNSNDRAGSIVDDAIKFKPFANVDWNNFVAGMTGGAVASAVFHPLELVKVRWIVYESATLLKRTQLDVKQAPKYRPKYRSLLDTVRNVYRTENGVRGLYRGLVINTVASGTAWGSYFLIYNALKEQHRQSKSLSVVNYTLDATIAGMVTIMITNPLFLIKTRMCLQYSMTSETSSSTARVVKYTSSWHAFKTLIRTEGLMGMYKGIVPGFFGTINGTIQMVTYDLMKEWWLRRLNRRKAANSGDATPQSLNSFHYSLFSGLSKILAVTCTYPFQVIRIRIQDQHQNYANILDVVRKTFRNEKFYGFYKGLIPCLLRVTPAASLTFIVYENLIKFLKKQ